MNEVFVSKLVFHFQNIYVSRNLPDSLNSRILYHLQCSHYIKQDHSLCKINMDILSSPWLCTCAYYIAFNDLGELQVDLRFDVEERAFYYAFSSASKYRVPLSLRIRLFAICVEVKRRDDNIM